MRDRLQQCLTGFFIAVGSCAGIVPALAVDDVRLQAASNATTDWLTYGHTYENQRFSTLDQINRNNVSRLAPRWIYQTGISATFLASPVAYCRSPAHGTGLTGLAPASVRFVTRVCASDRLAHYAPAAARRSTA